MSTPSVDVATATEEEEVSGTMAFMKGSKRKSSVAALMRIEIWAVLLRWAASVKELRRPASRSQQGEALQCEAYTTRVASMWS